jgi:hypothetical protein
MTLAFFAAVLATSLAVIIHSIRRYFLPWIDSLEDY